MIEVVLFFPDIKRLAAYSSLLESGPVEINSEHLTLKACLSHEQIEDASFVYEAIPCSAATWEQLEQWFDACRKRPYPKLNGYAWAYSRKINDAF